MARAGDLGHIHDLVLDTEGNLLVAAHTGLYRIDGSERAVLVGAEQHDLMALARDGDDLIASGHPDLRLDQYRVPDRPPFLGLARSPDDGATWKVESLLGHADFHALAPTDAGIYAAETGGRIWHLDQSDAWNQLGEIEARDLAVDPTDTAHQVAIDHGGGVWISADGAATWTPAPEAPALVEIEWLTHQVLLGVTESGDLWTATAPGGAWDQKATGPSDVETLYVDPTGTWWITVHGGAIFASTDQGLTWNPSYTPPRS